MLDTVNDPRFADLTPAQIVAILTEERIYVGSGSTFYYIIRKEGLLMHRGGIRQPREPRSAPILEARGVHQVLTWDVTLLLDKGSTLLSLHGNRCMESSHFRGRVV